jgi:AcrR family transcriptional regulator
LIEDTIGQLYFLSIQKFVNAYKKFNGYSKTMIKQAKKNKRRIEDIRRVELIEAAYRIFMQSGLKGLTTTRICNEAGMSQGILTYYFKDKDEVLFEMVRLANRILMNDVVSRLKLATTGWERVVAVIEGNFPPQRFDRNTRMPPITSVTLGCSTCSTAGSARI